WLDLAYATAVQAEVGQVAAWPIVPLERGPAYGWQLRLADGGSVATAYASGRFDRRRGWRRWVAEDFRFDWLDVATRDAVRRGDSLIGATGQMLLCHDAGAAETSTVIGCPMVSTGLAARNFRFSSKETRVEEDL